jgi:hypothetical protein
MDSTTIQLCSELLRGVGRKRLDGVRMKEGIMVHAMMNAFIQRSFRVNMFTAIRLHVMSHVELLEFILGNYTT